jgi:hypothetical protein
LNEVEELRATVSRLNADVARSIGWESKLRNAVSERDDLRQECEAEAQRARVAENRMVALGDKNGMYLAAPVPRVN